MPELIEERTQEHRNLVLALSGQIRCRHRGIAASENSSFIGRACSTQNYARPRLPAPLALPGEVIDTRMCM